MDYLELIALRREDESRGVPDRVRMTRRDRPAAFRKALEWGDRIPLGVIFRAERRIYEDLGGLKGSTPLKGRAPDKGKLADIFEEFH